MKIIRVFNPNKKDYCSKDLAEEKQFDYISGKWYYLKRTYKSLWNEEHRVRDCMSIKLHCILEDAICSSTRWIRWRFHSKYLFYLFYDIIFGLLTCYSMKEIIRFWLRRK